MSDLRTEQAATPEIQQPNGHGGMIQITLVPKGQGEVCVQVHQNLPGGWMQALKVLGAAVQVAAAQASMPLSPIVQPPWRQRW